MPWHETAPPPQHPHDIPYSNHHFISCGLSPLRRLNVLRRYSSRNGSFLMFVKSALSTAFWSLARALATFFFYRESRLAVELYMSLLSQSCHRRANLWLFSLLEKGFLSALLLFLLSRKVTLLPNLLHCLLVNPLQLDFGRRRDYVSSVDSP